MLTLMASPVCESDRGCLAEPPLPMKAEVLRILEANQLACEYQPIVRVSDQEIWAYEALARFRLDEDLIAPNLVFDALHSDRTRFFMLESRSKRFQLRHRPKGARLFVNLDPKVVEIDHHLEHWLGIFGSQQDLVVEILENTSAENLDSVRSFADRLHATGVDVALDDVGGHENFFSFELLEHCQILKLDRYWLSRFERDPAYIDLIKGMLSFARSRGIHSVLEGVETASHLECAKTLGIDFVQGFLYRDAFINVREPVSLPPVLTDTLASPSLPHS